MFEFLCFDITVLERISAAFLLWICVCLVVYVFVLLVLFDCCLLCCLGSWLDCVVLLWLFGCLCVCLVVCGFDVSGFVYFVVALGYSRLFLIVFLGFGFGFWDSVLVGFALRLDLNTRGLLRLPLKGFVLPLGVAFGYWLFLAVFRLCFVFGWG